MNKKYGKSLTESLCDKLVLIQVSQNLDELNGKDGADRIEKAKALQDHLKDRTSPSKVIYMNSRNISEDWRETFAKWGYVPCVQ